ncbi:hypothetical protein AAY473_006572 [Plecturocebus cupreus]
MLNPVYKTWQTEFALVCPVILGQTLSKGECDSVMVAAQQSANTMHMTNPGGYPFPRSTPLGLQYPGKYMGKEPHVPLSEGMKAIRAKPVNYNKLALIDQWPHENLTILLERLDEALAKNTNLDPDPLEGQLFIKDHFPN